MNHLSDTRDAACMVSTAVLCFRAILRFCVRPSLGFFFVFFKFSFVFDMDFFVVFNYSILKKFYLIIVNIKQL